VAAVFEIQPKTLSSHVPQQPTHLVPAAPLHDAFDDCILEIRVIFQPLEVVLPEEILNLTRNYHKYIISEYFPND